MNVKGIEFFALTYVRVATTWTATMFHEVDFHLRQMDQWLRKIQVCVNQKDQWVK